MTKDDDRKRLVRARMAKTGESYTAARSRLLHADDRRAPAAALGSRPDMTAALISAVEQAKQLAAEDGADQITPVHLCVGAALTPNSIAQQALLDEGISADDWLTRTTPNIDVQDAPEDRGLSVTARAALEHARAANAPRRPSLELEPVVLGGRLVQEFRDGHAVYVARPPLRTGHLLLGIIREGSAISIAPALGAPDLQERIQQLLATDLELSPRWSSQPRFHQLPKSVRALLAEFDIEVVRPPEAIGDALYRDVEALLDSLPAHRRAQPAIAIWYLAKHRVRQQLENQPTRELRSLTTSAIEGMLKAAIDDDPTVVRARKWADRRTME